MLRFTAPPRVTICGPGGSIWVTKPVPGVAGLVSVLQVPASKYSEAVRGPDFAVVALDQSGTLLLTIDTRGSLYSYQLRHNRFSCLDKAQSAGTAALFAGPRLVFAAFSDGSLRVYDISKSALVAMFREHRSPVRHLALSRELDELLSTSVDGVMVWDIKKLRRKRVLGSGPYGAVQASYTPDGLAIVTQFKDGSFYVWAAGNFTLLRSFTLPLGPALRPAQSAFALSPDGQWLVACGAGLPLLLLYSIIGGELLYGVGLPAPPTALDQAAAGQAADAAAAAAAAAEGHAGAAQLPPAGHLEGPAAATALAATLPMAVGATQVRFLPDSATVAALLTDGSVAFVDVLGCQAVGSVPYTFPNRQDCMFDADERVEQMALVANGKVMLYDLEATRTNVQPPRPLPRVLPAQLDDLAAAVALQSLQRQQAPEEQQHKAQATAQPVRQVEQARDAERAGGMARDTQRAQDTQRASQGKVATSGLTAAAGKRKAGAPAVAAGGGAAGAAGGVANRWSPPRRGAKPFGTVAAGGLTAPGAAAAPLSAPLGGGAAGAASAGVALDRSRLESLLEAFGEYPAKYRLLIWDYLLQLPHNTSAFSALAGLGAHPAFKDLPAQLGLPSRAMAQRLASTLSQLAHWCPVFAESSFLPDLVFPFVKLFASSPGPLGTADGGAVLSAAALDERCFETLATLIAGGWLRGWWERFPHPPLGLLTRLQDLLGLHDAPVAAHFSACRGGFAAVVWPHLATLWTELLSRGDWMRLWDHCITAGPDLLYFFIAAYWVSLRSGLLACDTDHKLANWLAGPPPVDVGKVLRTAYLLRERTPAELRPVPAEWQPLPPGPTYTDFKGFPEAAVEVFSADRKRIRDAEDAIMRRRAVVSELELRTRAVALQAASLSTERQQLAALEEERRGLLRQLEAETAAELARLDDRAKEEKLKQVAAVERAYQANLLEVRATWQRELESVRAEVAHKRALAAQQVRSREEDEQIKKLEFHAQQRMWELEEDTRRAALAAAVRDELGAQQAEMEAKQRVKLKEWETDEEARRLRFQAEAARRSEVAATAEAAAARNAAAREVLSMTLEAEDQLVKLDGQRRLRRLTEEAALVTAEARAAEEARAAARAKAEREAVQIRAAADLAWFEAEQLRREQLLEEERQQMQAMADAAREKLADTEAAARTMAAQAELLERRRHLERQNVEEEAQVRRLLGAMAAERARDAGLVVTLEAKQEEMKAKLEHAARVGSLQREVESSEAAAAAALRAQLSEQQRLELAELRRQHEAAMQQLAGEREGQAAEAAARLRAQLQAQQAAEVRDMTSTFERSLADMERELLLEQVRLARSAAAAAASSGQHTSQTSYSTSAAAASSSNTTSATTSAAATSQAAASTAGAGAGGVGGRDAAQSRPAPNGAPGSAVGGHAAGGTAAAARPQTGPSGSAANLLSRLLAVETPTRTSVMSESDYTPGSLPSTTATATPSPSPLPDAVLGRRSAIGATAATLGGAASGLARRAGAPPQPKGHPPRFGLPLTAAATAQAADREAEPRQRSGSTSTGPTSGATSGSNTRGSSGNGSGVGDDANGEGAVYALRRAGVSESSGLTATVRARDVGEATGPVAGAIGDGWLSQAARVQAALFPTTPATVSGSTTSAYTAPSSILPASSPASSASMYLPGPGPLDRSTEAATAAAAAVGSAGRAALAVLEAVSPERPTPGRESWEARSTGRGGSPSSLSGALRRLGLGDDMSELSTGATSAGATVTAAQAGGGDVDMSVAVTPGLSPGQYGSGGSMSSLDTTPLPSRTTRELVAAAGRWGGAGPTDTPVTASGSSSGAEVRGGRPHGSAPSESAGMFSASAGGAGSQPLASAGTDAGAGAVSGASSGAPSASFSGSGSGASRGSGGDSGPGASELSSLQRSGLLGLSAPAPSAPGPHRGSQGSSSSSHESRQQGPAMTSAASSSTAYTAFTPATRPAVPAMSASVPSGGRVSGAVSHASASTTSAPTPVSASASSTSSGNVAPVLPAAPAGSAGSARNDETASVAGSSAGSGARSGSRAIASAAEAGADATAPSPGLTESQLPSPGPSLGPDLSPGLASTVTLGVSPLAPGSAYSPSAASYPYQSRQSMVRGSPARSPGVSESGRPSLLQTYSGGAGLPSLPGGDLDMYSAGLAADFAASTRLAMAMTEAESEAARRQQQQQQQAARSARPSSSSGVAAGGAASAVSPSPDVAELLRRLRLAVEESPARPLQPPAAQAPAQPPRLRHQEAAASPALLPPHAGDRHGAGGGGPAPWSAHPSPAPMGFGSRVESAAGSASDLSQHVERSGSGGGSGNGSGDERAALEPARLAAAAPYGASSAPYRAPSPPRGAPTGSLGPSPLSRARGSGGGSEAPHYMKTWYPGSPAPADSHSLLPSSTATPQHAGDAAGAGGSSAGDQTGDLSALLRGLGGASAPLSDLETSPGGDTYTHTYTDMDLLYGHAADVDSLLYTGSAAGGAGETGFTPGSTFRTDADETATLEELGEEIEEIQL
ncbi:hypothetical protein CHLRE_02g074000v5 [Chlamydomonas reinhardtii]|uniref:Uncharacterized protein n=1 Tax=Chlamydomonas reinhardtii TaxID=3055 RepID=A0A2K3E003_CHLRE|nr:uncharacterized protein CHLRE_02g074000v5 [Chlamydomonas reinhardtii]PNW86118.1 hypothetical protein CHLRE_02g074000v5 [Chlamydomonas reinhardtii]